MGETCCRRHSWQSTGRLSPSVNFSIMSALVPLFPSHTLNDLFKDGRQPPRTALWLPIRLHNSDSQSHSPARNCFVVLTVMYCFFLSLHSSSCKKVSGEPCYWCCWLDSYPPASLEYAGALKNEKIFPRSEANYKNIHRNYSGQTNLIFLFSYFFADWKSIRSKLQIHLQKLQIGTGTRYAVDYCGNYR